MRLILLLLISAVCIHSSAQNNSGGIVFTLGKDTTLVGNYQMQGNVFYIHAVSFTPSLNVHQWRGRFFDNGEMEMAEGLNTKPVGGKEAEIVFTYKMHSTADSTYIEQKRGENITKQQYKPRTMITNSIGGQSMIYLLPMLANYAPSKIGDSVLSTHIVLNGARPFVIKKQTRNQLIMGSTAMGYFRVNLDNKGKTANIDATGTSWNVKGQLVPLLNIDSVISARQLVEAGRPPAGAINKLDSVQTVINGVLLKIKYSRPSVRGRNIYGEVVPWNRFWRTGANAATRITVTKPVYFGDKELPAGDYSIWTMPSQTGWKIMFNKQANIWGTEYNPEHDVLVIPLQTTSLKVPVELFTFFIDERGDDGEISFEWEKLKGSLRFRTSR
jgi:hypothetical protein